MSNQMLWHARIFFVRHPYLYPAEAKSADAVLPNAAAGASAPMLRFESSASAGLSNFILLKKACGQKTTGFSYFTSF
jgi:hypothetical protein